MAERSRAKLRIAIMGDFDRGKHSHWATEAALFHAAAHLDVAIEPCWVSTPSLSDASAAQQLAGFDAIWGAPGSPYASMAGVLRGIEYARQRDIAYLGTCAGFQYALIEFTRNVLGVLDADSAENTPGGENNVITPVLCEPPARVASAPRLAGTGVARPVPGSLVERLCGSADLRGEYFCSFEVNAAFVQRWLAAGLRAAVHGAEGEMRAFELAQNRFFVATLFQPQLSSSYARPHPLVEGFLRAALAASRA
jgi:CTP synthase (UTP-ammonia lyase)